MDDPCCNVALLVISLLEIGLLQQATIVTGDVRCVLKNGMPDTY